LVDVRCDLFGTPLRGDVLSAGQRRPATLAREADQILGHQRYRASCAPCPGGIGRRIDDHLADDAPTGVVRVATRDEKPRQRLGHPDGVRL
jgi:hypothetical protein